MWLLTAQPVFDCGASATALTPAALATRVCAPGAGAWVVLLLAEWSPPCAHFAPAFARLAQEHGGGGAEGAPLRFGTLDLARWPGLAQRYGLDLNGAQTHAHAEAIRISRPPLTRIWHPRGSATSSQLPTVVLFDNGAEVDRLPRFRGGSVAAAAAKHGVPRAVVKGRWGRAEVERAFQLAERAAAVEPKKRR